MMENDFKEGNIFGVTFISETLELVFLFVKKDFPFYACVTLYFTDRV